MIYYSVRFFLILFFSYFSSYNSFAVNNELSNIIDDKLKMLDDINTGDQQHNLNLADLNEKELQMVLKQRELNGVNASDTKLTQEETKRIMKKRFKKSKQKKLNNYSKLGKLSFNGKSSSDPNDNIKSLLNESPHPFSENNHRHTDMMIHEHHGKM